MTLDEMYAETAMYTDETINKVNGNYDGNSMPIINKFRSAINYAYKKICREKYHPEIEDRINPGDILTMKFYRILSVKTEDGFDIDYSIEDNELRYDYDGAVLVRYQYIPNDLVNLTDEPIVPEEYVDYKIMCYYAAFQYLNIEDDDRAARWLSLWNDGFDSIKEIKVVQYKIKPVYDMGW